MPCPQACLLLRPGGLLLGSTLGAPTPRPWEAAYQAGRTRWLHSAQSLAALLRELGYEEVEVAPTRWRVGGGCGAGVGGRSAVGASRGHGWGCGGMRVGWCGSPMALCWLVPGALRCAALGRRVHPRAVGRVRTRWQLEEGPCPFQARPGGSNFGVLCATH